MPAGDDYEPLLPSSVLKSLPPFGSLGHAVNPDDLWNPVEAHGRPGGVGNGRCHRDRA